MPVAAHSYLHFLTPTGTPGAPTAVTSIARDGGADVAFLPPASQGGTSITSYTVTPYIGGSAQTPAVIPVASLTSITGSDGNTYKQGTVTGLANGTAYTFTVHASNTAGAGPESAASGANTPLQYLVFGDDFGGPAGGPIHPEWWVYDRCGYLAQSEVQWYRPDHCALDGAGNLQLTAEHVPYTGTTYPSDGSRTNVTQPWTSGGCQSNTRTYAPSSGNFMIFEARESVMSGVGSGYWPGLFWLEGQSALNAWKTDPAQGGWNSTDHAEIDIAEWPPGQSGTTQFVVNTWTSGSPDSFAPAPGGGYNATAMHVYRCKWKPGTSCQFFLDGSSTHSASSNIGASGAQYVLLLYLQMLAGGSTATASCLIDYVRVYDSPV